jgi:hypothetical protein
LLIIIGYILTEICTALPQLPYCGGIILNQINHEVLSNYVISSSVVEAYLINGVEIFLSHQGGIVTPEPSATSVVRDIDKQGDEPSLGTGLAIKSG